MNLRRRFGCRLVGEGTWNKRLLGYCVPGRRRPRENAGSSAFYLRAPDARTVAAGAGIGEKAGPLDGIAAGPVFLHVGTASVEPTGGHAYDPTEGCTTDPYPSVPVVCANASVLVRTNAVASAIVVTFMAASSPPR